MNFNSQRKKEKKERMKWTSIHKEKENKTDFY